MKRSTGILLAATMLSCTTASAQDTAQSRSPSFMAADRFMEASGQNADMVFYMRLLVPVIVRAYRQEHPEIGQRCATETENGLRHIMADALPELALSATNIYAHAFTVAELNELSAFYSSDLGKRYNLFLKQVVERGVEKPRAALPFVNGVQAILNDPTTSPQKRLEVVMHLADRYMKEDDVTRLRTFFYNGTGKKYHELGPEIERKVVATEMTSLTKAGASLRAELKQSGACS